MSGYPQVPLGELLTLRVNEVQVEPDAVYRIAGIYSFGKGLFEREAIRGVTTSYKKLARLRHNQFVLSKLNGWEGAVDVVSAEFDGCHVSGEYPTFSIDSERVDPTYLRWIARWPAFWDRLIPRGSMVRRKRVQLSQFLDVTIPLPPLEEQRRQSAYLDRIARRALDISNRLSVYDASHVVAALPPLVDELVRRVASDTATVGDLVDLVSDTVHPGDPFGEAASFVGLQHVERHTGVRVGEEGLDSIKGRKFRFKPGDVVYGYLRPYLNKVWAADRHGLCSVDQYVLRPKPGTDAEVLAYILRGQAFLDRAIELTHSLQLPRLRSGLLTALDVPVVAEAEAPKLAGRLDAVRDQVTEVATLREKQAQAAKALTSAALNEVFG